MLPRIVLLFLVGLGLASCEAGETSGGAVCVFEQTTYCTGQDGCVGIATCLPDLTAYGECDCGGDLDASADASRDASSDAPGGG